MRPQAPVRRYDVFAAWNYLEALAGGQSDAHARRHGIWIATVVAARKFRKAPAGAPKDGEPEKPKRTDFLGLTARDYESRVRLRMGATFHDRVFLPALRRLRKEGRQYVEIRDEVRAGWTP